MEQKNVVLCVSNVYEQKYYLNPIFDRLPEQIKDELKILCVLFTEDVGGILSMEFEEDGRLFLHVISEENDLLFDEIGSALKVKEIQRGKAEFLEALENYYKLVICQKEMN